MALCENCGASHKNLRSIHECDYCGKELCNDCGNLIDDLYWECNDCNKIGEYRFPEKFYHFGESSNCVRLNNVEIKKMLNNIKFEIKDINVGDYVIQGTGDTIVIGLRMEDEYVFMVCKDRYELSVDTKQIDDVEF